MANIQLERLNRSLLEQGSGERPLLVTEKLSLSRKALERLKKGDRIELGEEMLSLYVRQGEELLYRARLVQPEEGVEACLLEESAVGGSLLSEGSGKKRRIVEGRLALLRPTDLKRGAILSFPWKVSEHIHLFDGQRFFATAALVECDERYALKIVEVCREY